MISSQIQITHAKKMNIVHMMLRKGYESASTIICTFRRGKRDYACVTTLEASSHRDDRLALSESPRASRRGGASGARGRGQPAPRRGRLRPPRALRRAPRERPSSIPAVLTAVAAELASARGTAVCRATLLQEPRADPELHQDDTDR